MSFGARLFVGLQHVLPQHALTRLVNRIARVRSPAVRRALIRGFLKLYDVNLAEAAETDLERYGSFNEFFTRALRHGARPLCPGERDLASPCDGTVSQRGTLDGPRLLQAKLAAKSHWYTVEELLGDAALAAPFTGGEFATIYLAPYDYHRVHMPLAGTLRTARYLPGRLFSVNAATVAAVPRLFAQNERIVCTFDTAAGPLAVVFVGALNVGSMGLVWLGDVPAGRARALDVPAPPLVLGRGAELGRFNLGSTIVLLLPRGSCEWASGFEPGAKVRMGTAIGRIVAPAAVAAAR